MKHKLLSACYTMHEGRMSMNELAGITSKSWLTSTITRLQWLGIISRTEKVLLHAL